ncbi:hypothetical protein HMPREF9180_1286 [Streptococcus peroris ATCC 700780]|uniref:Uncharacterized protein n=1 Tax=Streptococcus peroris ATCC 700780 TaxID=888746 RepID=E8KCT1_9STRE|nr:hypothetical protein HMPREF9180_1286 [Streptococcus peroris ATCC 700780]
MYYIYSTRKYGNIQIFVCQFSVKKIDNAFTVERGNASIV